MYGTSSETFKYVFNAYSNITKQLCTEQHISKDTSLKLYDNELRYHTVIFNYGLSFQSQTSVDIHACTVY